MQEAFRSEDEHLIEKLEKLRIGMVQAGAPAEEINRITGAIAEHLRSRSAEKEGVQ